MSTPGRLSKACSICHKKKIKCDLARISAPCTNCRLGGYPCRPHQRKRKHYALSPSPLRETDSPNRSTIDTSATTTYLTAVSGDAIADTNTMPSGGQTFNADSVISPQSPIPQDDARICDIPTAEQNYDGRADYVVSMTEDTIPSDFQQRGQNELSDLDMEFLRRRRALDLPPRIVRDSLIDAFMERCHPWMPIIERRWLEETDTRQPSILLLQAVFLAGSRVLSGPLVHTSSSEFYERARALFFHRHERNTTIVIVATSLLHWWNPTGPEMFSTNGSAFWVRIGVELAYQVGLHKEPPAGPFRGFQRRLWWTLVSRDNIIAVGTGRPRTINLEDSDMALPTLSDFAVRNTHAKVFVAYVPICKFLGDIAECQRRQKLTPSLRRQFEDALFRWAKELPRELRVMQPQGDSDVCTLASYNFEARQLSLLYFTALVLLHRSSSPQGPVSTICLVASSFVVSIFEEFLSRDQLRYLGPAFAFYALAAGLVQLTGFCYDSLQDIAEHEFEVVRVALLELGKRWGSAHNVLRALIRAKDAIKQQPRVQGQPPPLPRESVSFFSDYGPELCRLWHVGFSKAKEKNTVTVATFPKHLQPHQTNPASGSLETPATLSINPSALTSDSTPQSTSPYGSVADIYGEGLGAAAIFDDPLALEGSWLFETFDLQGMLNDTNNDT